MSGNVRCYCVLAKPFAYTVMTMRGLHFKWPIAEEVRRFDGRILTVDTPAQRYFTLEKKPLIVDLFVKWRVGDVQRYYTATSG